jgi:hypothetical protein
MVSGWNYHHTERKHKYLERRYVNLALESSCNFDSSKNDIDWSCGQYYHDMKHFLAKLYYEK